MIKNKFGFTLIEVVVAVIIVGILASLALPSYINSAERFRGSEAKETLSKCYAGYQRLMIDGEGVSAGNPLTWSRIGMSNPNLKASRFFDYRITNSDSDPQIMWADRRGGATKNLSIDLHSGCLTKSSPY